MTLIKIDRVFINLDNLTSAWRNVDGAMVLQLGVDKHTFKGDAAKRLERFLCSAGPDLNLDPEPVHADAKS